MLVNIVEFTIPVVWLCVTYARSGSAMGEATHQALT